jgi:hypothetical protein
MSVPMPMRCWTPTALAPRRRAPSEGTNVGSAEFLNGYQYQQGFFLRILFLAGAKMRNQGPGIATSQKYFGSRDCSLRKKPNVPLACRGAAVIATAFGACTTRFMGPIPALWFDCSPLLDCLAKAYQPCKLTAAGGLCRCIGMSL